MKYGFARFINILSAYGHRGLTNFSGLLPHRTCYGNAKDRFLMVEKIQNLKKGLNRILREYSKTSN